MKIKTSALLLDWGLALWYLSFLPSPTHPQPSLDLEEGGEGRGCPALRGLPVS